MRMDEKTQKALEKFGLSEKEAKVYLSCLELGTSPAYDVSVKADIPRTLTYDILERLIEQKLIQLVYEGKKKFFRAAPPSKLFDILKEKRLAVDSVMQTLKILQNNNPEKRRAHAHLFVGKDGIKTIYEDILKSKVNEYLAIGCSGMAPRILPYYLPGYYMRKAKLKINLRLIFNDTKKARERANALKKYGFVEVRYIPERYGTPISIYVYGDKTALLMWSKLEPLAFRIDCKYITQGFRNYLLAMWEGAKRK